MFQTTFTTIQLTIGNRKKKEPVFSKFHNVEYIYKIVKEIKATKDNGEKNMTNFNVIVGGKLEGVKKKERQKEGIYDMTILQCQT